MQGIYYIRNRQNGRTYVGSSINVAQRLGAHGSELRHGRHLNRALQADWDHYGADNFELVAVEEVAGTMAELAEAEQRHVAAMQNPYNVAVPARPELPLRPTAPGEPQPAIDTALIGRAIQAEVGATFALLERLRAADGNIRRLEAAMFGDAYAALQPTFDGAVAQRGNVLSSETMHAAAAEVFEPRLRALQEAIPA